MASPEIFNVIDIGRIARPFRLVRLANYFMVVGCGTWLIGQIVNAPHVTAEWVPIVGLLWLGLIVNFWAGLATAGMIDRRMWARLYVSLPLLFLSCGTAAVSLFRSMPANVIASENPSGNATLVAAVLAMLMALSALLGLLAVAVLDRARVRPLSLRLRTLVRELDVAVVPAGPKSRAKPVSTGKGLLYTTLAAVVLIGPHFVADEIWQPNAPLLSLLSLSGWAFLFHARRYFMPDARTLLAADKRRPVLFLRSFEDDERHSYVRSELSVVDFGLETRLAGHFRRFGPFIAIGSPAEPTPRPGVATAQLSNEEWQGVVKGWMGEARTIVLLAGTTEWVNWELAQVLAMGHHQKLILMFPRTDGWLFWRRERGDAKRLARLRQTLKGTPWSMALPAIDRPQDMRSMVLRAGGGITLVTSRPRSRDSYHLAAMIAQRELMRSAGASVEQNA